MTENERKLFKDDYLKQLRRQMMIKGISNKGLGDLIGFTRQGVSKILKGEGSSVAVSKVCNALRFDIKKIMK